jgi:hypothetical protein
MTDVFFSYSSKDRERVRPIRDALLAEGFEVFWDQDVPPGRNWDKWIRQHLDAAHCAVVFWSEHSVTSDNVMHEATIAKNAGKLIPVLIDPIDASQFPMGHYTTQGVMLPPEGMTLTAFRRLCAAVEARAMRSKTNGLEGRVTSLTDPHQKGAEFGCRKMVDLRTAFEETEKRLLARGGGTVHQDIATQKEEEGIIWFY